MTRFQLWHLKNEMLAANFLANFIGVVLIKLFLLINLNLNIWNGIDLFIGVGRYPKLCLTCDILNVYQKNER